MTTRSVLSARALVLLLLLGLGVAAVVPPAAAGSLPTGTPAGPVAPAAGVLDPGLSLHGPGLERVIVTGDDAQAAVQAAGGRVTQALPFVGGVAAEVPADRLRELADAAGVRAVTADRSVRFEEFAYDESTSASNFARTSQATQSWATGNYGKGVGVAVIDTGVSPMADFKGRLVHGPDLSGEGTIVDTYGHGTVMAGAIAGDGTDSRGRTGGAFTGVAPAAHVVAVKVAGRNGVVDVSTMLQAMHWVSAYRDQYKIRVLNLSWGVPSTQSPGVDPINHAVQRLWSQGIVVVVAAGNTGPNSGTIQKPGDDPTVLTVGALNDQGDVDPANDNVAPWSSRGPTAAGVAKPDLVAPGRSLVTTRGYGSTTETNNPKALLAPSYIRGSGTSQAAAVTSGLVALLLAARPTLTPDQVKALLVRTASPMAAETAPSQGAGRVQLAAAVAAPTPSVQNQPTTGSGLGSLDASRGNRRVQANCNGTVTEIRGEIDVKCQPWNGTTWTGTTWTGDAWTGTTWTGTTWTGTTWTGANWSDATWSGTTWTGGTWSGGSWEGGGSGSTSSTSWSGTTWTGTTWTGTTWTGTTWTGVAWTGSTWTNGEWTGDSYDDTSEGFLTAFWGGGPPPWRPLPGEQVVDPGRPKRAGEASSDPGRGAPARMP